MNGGWVRTDYTKLPVGNLQMGVNVLTFHVKNIGGPAGLVASLIREPGGQVLVSSMASSAWSWSA